MQLRHPALGRVIDVPESAAKVLAASGWEPAEEAPQAQDQPVEAGQATEED